MTIGKRELALPLLTIFPFSDYFKSSILQASNGDLWHFISEICGILSVRFAVFYLLDLWCFIY